jgi:FdrA protein
MLGNTPGGILLGHVKSLVVAGSYRDSVFLMKVSSQLSQLAGVEMASVMMATERNKELFQTAGLMTVQIQNAKPDDLAISLIAQTQEQAEEGIHVAVDMISTSNQEKKQSNGSKTPERLEQALAADSGRNMALISVAGDYAAYEAAKALRNNLDVMLYSDNISIADERRLKEMARDTGRIVMGPDCGTAIINGVPLAFANNVAEGCIGVVGASGTGTQEVTCIIDQMGQGISQAIGTGGRDLKQEVGGISFITGLQYLIQHDATKVIVLISKPPHDSVRAKIAELIQQTTKPVVVHYVGSDDYGLEKAAGAKTAATLAHTALLAVKLAGGITASLIDDAVYQQKVQDAVDKATDGRFLRGIFGGGTLCYEALDIFGKVIDPASIYSNIPLKNMNRLANLQRSIGHTFLDMGEDEFTVGKPHPMIDPTSKHKRIAEEMADSQVAVVLFDVVIGHGAFPDQAGDLAGIIKTAGKKHSLPCLIASVTGTEKDVPSRSDQIKKLQDAGVIILPSNDLAAKLACDVIQTRERG